MEYQYIYNILFIISLLIIIYKISNLNYENFTDISKQDLEGIQNISSMYKNGELKVAKLHVTDNAHFDKNIYSKQWIQGKHLKSTHDSWVDGKLTNGNLHVNDYVSTKRLDIRNLDGSNGNTHFNYNNTGTNYVRGKKSYFDAHNWMRTGLPNNKTYSTKDTSKYMKENGGNSDWYVGFMRGRTTNGGRYQNGYVTKGHHVGHDHFYFNGGWDKDYGNW